MKRINEQWNWRDDADYASIASRWVDDSPEGIVKQYTSWCRENGHLTPSAGSVLRSFCEENGCTPSEEKMLRQNFGLDEMRLRRKIRYLVEQVKADEPKDLEDMGSTSHESGIRKIIHEALEDNIVNHSAHDALLSNIEKALQKYVNSLKNWNQGEENYLAGGDFIRIVGEIAFQVARARSQRKK